MMKRGIVLLLVPLFLPLSLFAAPPAIDPVSTFTPGPYSARGQFTDGGTNRFYINRNQLLIRLTGCEYSERATDDNDGYCDPRNSAPPFDSRHWGGSFMGLVESIVNEKLLAATYYSVPPTNGGNSATEYTKIFRNYVDLIMKRLLDADKNTPLDYDNHTFLYVDRYNPALSESVPKTIIPGGKRIPITYDTNGDYIEGGWEPSPLLSGTCVDIPFIQGGTACINMYVVNVTQTVPYQDSPAGVTPAWRAGDLPNGGLRTSAPISPVNNVGGPMLDFDPYNPNNQMATSHLFLAGEPNRLYSFDAELATCTSAELVGSGNCDRNPFRDDDDSLAIEIQLTNLRLNVLFEPPFNPFAVGTSLETDRSVRNPGYRHRQSLNLQDITSGVTSSTCLNDDPNDPGGDGITTVSGYDPSCDLSQYLKAWGIVTVPILKIVLNARVTSVYKDNPPEPGSLGWETADTINLGLELQSVTLDTNFIFALNAGPYCNNEINDANGNGKGNGQDGFGIFYDRTDNPNNCFTPADGDNTVNDSDDATYLLSEQINAVLPYIRGEVEGIFRAFFNPNTNPGIYFGPTRLLNINETVGGVSIANPFAPTTAVTEYIWLQLSLESNVDSVSVATDLRTVDAGAGYRAYVSTLANIVGDSSSEFWADPWGVMMPFSTGMGLFLSEKTVPYMSGGVTKYSGVTAAVSCVTTATSLTGYKDGYGPNRLDDPFVSRPLPNLALTWSGSGLGYGTSIGNGGATTTQVDADSVLLGLKIPNVNGLQPFALPSSVAALGTRAVVPYNMQAPTFETYAIGVALHQNFLSKLLYEAIIRGILCIWIDPSDPTNSLGGTTLGDFLTTDLLGFFVPYLADNYPGQKMAIRVVPLLASPGTLKYYSPPQHAGERLRQYIFFDPTTWATSAVTNPIPRIQTGGISLYDPLKQRFLSAITTANLGPLWPDLSVIIPHLLVEFYVVDETAGKVYRRAFALDIGLNIGLNIDIVQDPGGPGALTFPTFMDPITGRYPQLARPPYSGTNFPIGCRTAAGASAYQCEITGVPSRLVLFLGGIADPELNAILIYDEMASVITFSTGTTLYTGAFAFPNTSAYVQAISNLIGLLLSGELSAFVEIGIDPAALLNVPIVFTVPYIGPSFVIRDPTSGVRQRSVGTPLNQVVNQYEGCGVDGSAVCGDPIFGTTTVTRDISDGDLNGYGDYLIAALNLDLSYLKADYLIRLIDAFLEQPVGGYACNGKDADGNPTTDVACVSEAFVNPFGDLLGGLGFAPSSEGFTGLPQGYVSPETIIKGIRKAHALETIIEYEGWHPTVPQEELTYSWRVDGGFWTPFVPATIARIPGLLEGLHVFEVKAKDPQGNVEYTPARIVFVVDSVAPRIRVLGDRVQSGTAHFLVDTVDSQTLPEAIRVSYRVDGGEWSAYSAYKEIALDLAPGQHTLEVRALDEAGNEGTVALTFVIEKGGFGCSLGGNPDVFSLLFLLGLFLPALYRLRRVA